MGGPCEQQKNTLQELYSILPDFFDHLFLAGAESGFLRAAACQLKVNGMLPRSWRAFAGRQKLAPSRARAPLPWLGLMALVGAALHQGLVMMAVAMVDQFTCNL